MLHQMSHQNRKEERALKEKNGFYFRIRKLHRNISYLSHSSGTVTHLDQDSFIIKLQVNYKGSSQRTSTLKTSFKTTTLYRSTRLCVLPQTMSACL